MKTRGQKAREQSRKRRIGGAIETQRKYNLSLAQARHSDAKRRLRVGRMICKLVGQSGRCFKWVTIAKGHTMTAVFCVNVLTTLPSIAKCRFTTINFAQI